MQSLVGVRADAFHSLSSVVGVQGNVLISDRFFKYADSRLHFGAAVRFDYNIYSSLTSYIRGTFLAEKELKPAYTIALGFGYRVF